MRQYDLEVKSILCVHSARAGAALLNGRERVSVETPQFWDAKILMESQNQMLSYKRQLFVPKLSLLNVFHLT